MSREWQVLWDNRLLFLDGLATTVELSLLAAIGSLILGLFLSLALQSPSRVVRLIARAYVDLMRCVPFLLFAYLVYFALPIAGLRLTNWQAGLTALLLYNVAYMADTIDAGWRTLPNEPVEAGAAFGFRGLPLLLHIVLPALVLRIIPLLGNQLIQIIKDSSFLTIIAVAELTHVANAIQSNYYIPFSAFLVAVVLYWLLCLAVEGVTATLERRARVRR